MPFLPKKYCVLLASLSHPSMKSLPLALDALLAWVADVPASCFAACTNIINTKTHAMTGNKKQCLSQRICAFQHTVLCFSAQCVVLFSTLCCAFQHSALCFSAQCVVLFSTMPSSSPFQSPSPWIRCLPQSVVIWLLPPKKSGQKWSQAVTDMTDRVLVQTSENL